MKFLALAILLLAVPALGDTDALSKRVYNGPNSNQTMVGTLCSAQASAAVCTSGGDEVVVDLRGFTTASFFSTQSTSTDYTCDVIMNDNGYDANSGVGQDRSTTSMTETQESITLDGVLGFVWISCSELANNAVTVTFVATK